MFSFNVARLVLLFGIYGLSSRHQTIANSLFGDSFLDNGMSNEPDFVENIKNITVKERSEAILGCVVRNLGKYKIGWLRGEDQTILTLDSKVVTHNSRVSVTHDGVQTWNLHIRGIRLTDKGCYMCQINTAVMKKQLGCIDVHVSPNIIDEETSSDITVREGDNATLVCKATGRPIPKILWKREDGEKIFLRRGMRETFRTLNDVPPAVSKRITVDVNFPPIVKIPSQLLGAPLNTDVVLECHIESCPRAFVYWVKNRGEVFIDGGLGQKNSTKYIQEETRNSYKVTVRLTIRNFSKRDVGIYTCIAQQSMGKAEGQVRVTEIKMSKGTSSATENQVVVTVPGFATPPMSTESRDVSGGIHHSTNRESLWTTYARDSVVSPHDTKSGDGRGRNIIASSTSGSTNILISLVPLIILFITTFFYPVSEILRSSR